MILWNTNINGANSGRLTYLKDSLEDLHKWSQLRKTDIDFFVLNAGTLIPMIQ